MDISSKKNHYYPKESAGRLMDHNLPVVSERALVSDVEELLLKEVKNFETINYIYIVDSNSILKGVISIKELFSNPKNSRIKDLMKTDLVTVRGHSDQEKVSRLAIAHSIKSVPVVNDKGVFLGAVSSDVILNILHNENIEDAMYSAGLSKSDNPSQMLLRGSSFSYFKKRLPWLLFGLFGGLLSAVIVGFFENLLTEAIILAVFLPAVVYMADAVGSQTQIVFIRSLTMDSMFNARVYYAKEVVVSFLLALLLSLVAAVFVALWWASAPLGLVLGISFFLTILVASVIAIVLPLFFYKMKLDPAVASGPFATVLRDLSSIVIYLVVVSIFMPFLV